MKSTLFVTTCITTAVLVRSEEYSVFTDHAVLSEISRIEAQTIPGPLRKQRIFQQLGHYFQQESIDFGFSHGFGDHYSSIGSHDGFMDDLVGLFAPSMDFGMGSTTDVTPPVIDLHAHSNPDLEDLISSLHDLINGNDDTQDEDPSLFEYHDTNNDNHLDAGEFAQFQSLLLNIQNHEWSYENDGQTLWPLFNSYCDNTQHRVQSPIDIDTNHAAFDSSVCGDTNGLPLTWVIRDNLFQSGHHWRTSFTDHHTWHVSPVDMLGNSTATSEHCVMELSNVNGIDSKFCLASFHVHYGANNNEGSEHLVDGHAFPLEMHFVHYRNDFNNKHEAVEAWEALQDNGGDHYVFSVVSVMFELDDSYLYRNDAIAKILEVNQGDAAAFQNFDLADIIPSNIGSHDYYTYQGSLTTPGCTPAVNWIVMKEPLKIGHSEMQHIHDVTHHSFIFRSPQINDNPVYDCDGMVVSEE